MIAFQNPHILKRPDSPDWSVDLTEFRKARISGMG
jgi:hypothetical protein